jgi:hypothetical protein
MIIPNTDVNLATEVRNVLNANGGSVSNNITTFFKPDANTNIYAKFKPVPYSADFVDDKYRWYGKDGWCGINVPNANGSSGLDSIVDSEWSWDYPTGGPSEPLRLGDYRGYNPDAEYLFESRLTSKLAAYEGAINISAWVYSREGITNNLSVNDSDKFGKFRLGVRMKEPNGYSYIMTSSNTAADTVNDSGILQINYPIESDGQYQATTFLTYDNYPTKTGFPSVITCYSLPKQEGFTNYGVGNFVEGVTGTHILCRYIGQTLQGTYTAVSDHGYDNPYQVDGYYDKQYLKLEVTVDSNIPIAQRVLYWSGLTLNAKNVLGKNVTVVAGNDKDIINLYDASFNQVGSISNLSTDLKNPTICYLEVKLFNKGVTTSDESSSAYGEIIETHPDCLLSLNGENQKWYIDELYIKGV